MNEKEKRIEKEFVLSDSTVNDLGFRLLTSGYQLQEFAKNPIGYYMHKRDDGVVVKWNDLVINGDSIIAKPSINLANGRGQQTLNEVEAGFLNAASMGHFVVLEFSNDPKLMLPGQTGPTITKWYNRECSLVDLGSNINALTQLYDVNNKMITLTSLSGQSLKQNNSGSAANNGFPKTLYLKDEEIGTVNLIAALNTDYNLYASYMIRRYGLAASFDGKRADWKKLQAYVTELNRCGLTNLNASDYDKIQKKYFQQELHNEELNDTVTPIPIAGIYEIDQKQSAFPQVLYLDGKDVDSKILIAALKQDYTLYAALVTIHGKGDIDESKVDKTRLHTYLTEYKRARLVTLNAMSASELSRGNLLSELRHISVPAFNAKMKR